MKLMINLNRVATIPMIVHTGIACYIFIWKNIMIIGIFIPAPDKPPAFDSPVMINIKNNPILS